MKYDFIMEKPCPVCGKIMKYDESIRGNYYLGDTPVGEMTHDCHGIPFRTVCEDCYEKIMTEKGFDGETYTELDECIDYDY